MRNLMWIVAVGILSLGLVGCHCMRGTCPCCSKQANASASGKHACAKCGMSGAACTCPAGSTALPEITTAALKTLMDSGAPMILVDARTGKYDDGRRIPGALSLDPMPRTTSSRRR
ncbi:MAG: hypothetical protein PHW60_03440 [Kiritimatiellae bacterium]|nr:hypothetical protein [Kiritimatiellia bacterium]